VSAVRAALVEAALLGVVGGLVGVQVVLRRLPFFALAMTHATFPGVVLAAVLGVNLYLGGGVFGLLVVLGVLALSRRPGQDVTTVVGIVLSAGFALGVVLVSAQQGFSRDLTAYTVGQILTVGPGDLVAVAVVGVAVALLLGVAGRQLTFRAFDPVGYAASGFRTGALDLALLLAVEAVILVSVPAVGAILAVAVLVAPAAIARLWTHHVPTMTLLAALVGAGCGVAGILISTRLDVAAGATVTLVAGAGFALSLAATALRARAGGARRGRRPAADPAADAIICS
jgi:ABC-type Mn2+/Zn2+ transport system permease subunit